MAERWRRDGGELARSWPRAHRELGGVLAEKYFLLSLKVSWRRARRVLSEGRGLAESLQRVWRRDGRELAERWWIAGGELAETSQRTCRKIFFA